jgi:hypothetical protein
MLSMCSTTSYIPSSFGAYIDSDTILGPGSTPENQTHEHCCPHGGYTFMEGKWAIHKNE